jgi:ATP-binding cassette subfamily B protein
MYQNIQRFAFSDIDKYATSGLITRMTTDVNSLQSAFQQILGISVRAPFKLVLSILMCLVIDARLSLIFLVALIILSFSLYHIISRVARLFQQVFVKYDELNQSVQENVTGIRLVKAFVREDYENEKFARAAENLYKLYVKAESLMAWNHPIMNMVVYGCIIALSWMGAHYIVDGTLTTGELTSLFTYIMSILMSLMMLSMVFVMLTQSAASAKRVAEIIEEEPDIVNPEHPVFEIADGSLEFRNVRFDYVTNKDRKSKVEGHKRSALFNINLNIQSGETIGVIGGTGSGKSTLISLISRLYDPTQGEVFVGGHNVKDYDLTALRHAVSVVLQQNILFSGSVLDNLRWGNPDATLEECRKACQMAQADDFVSAMPEGYDTHIEQGGTNVSGGQKQRLCIARALLKHPKILILDDSTSACDTATDAKIREAFHTQLPDMTKVIIAQRILSVKDCDRILVMDNGVVTGFDTHENLLKNNTLYQEINAIQNENVGDFDEVKGGAA